MNAISRKTEWAAWGGLVLVIVTIAALYVLNRVSPPTPSSSLEVASASYPEVPDFRLTNQVGKAVSRADLRGRIWIANLIFTRCPGPCAEMTRQMARLQSALPTNAPVKLVSLTTDPEFDTAQILARYGERFGAKSDRWWFLTGTKQQIAQLAVEGLKFTALDKDPSERSSENDLFIHSTILVLVDQHGRLRGAFDSLQPGAQEQLLKGVEKLRTEKN